MITFETVTVTKVKLNGKHVGNIKQVKTFLGMSYQYFPKGKKDGGVIYSNLDLCKRSLTGE